MIDEKALLKYLDNQIESGWNYIEHNEKLTVRQKLYLAGKIDSYIEIKKYIDPQIPGKYVNVEEFK